MIPLGPKGARQRGHIMKCAKSLLKNPKALELKYILNVTSYSETLQSCSSYYPRATRSLARGVISFALTYLRKFYKKLYCRFSLHQYYHNIIALLKQRPFTSGEHTIIRAYESFVFISGCICMLNEHAYVHNILQICDIHVCTFDGTSNTFLWFYRRNALKPKIHN